MTEVLEREEVVHAIGRVCGLKFQRMHEMLDALGLYHGQPPVLFTLWHEDGLTQSELSDRINRSPSTTTKTVQRMEKAGFLERRPDPEDERVSRVYLTQAGRDIKADVEAVWRALGDELFADFTDEEVTTFYALLQRVHRNMGADHTHT